MYVLGVGVVYVGLGIGLRQDNKEEEKKVIFL